MSWYGAKFVWCISFALDVQTPLPEGWNVIGCRWVEKTKYKVDDSLDSHRYKAKGYSQVEGVITIVKSFVLWSKWQ